MQAPESLNGSKPDPRVRTLKIEPDGDFFKGLIKPKIRLMGYWLARAGFKPGNRVSITCIAPGVIELRSADVLLVEEKKQPSQGQSDCPF